MLFSTRYSVQFFNNPYYDEESALLRSIQKRVKLTCCPIIDPSPVACACASVMISMFPDSDDDQQAIFSKRSLVGNRRLVTNVLSQDCAESFGSLLLGIWFLGRTKK